MTLIYVKANCHCGLNNFQIPILTSTLPQGFDMCHCNACRHITGQMFLHVVLMDGPPLSVDSGLTPDTHEPADLSTLSMCKASDKVLRYFCPRCFAHILYDLHQPNQLHTWAVSSGAMERAEGLVKTGYHIFVPDTLDGGVADHVRYLNGKEMARYMGWEGSKQVPIGWKSESLSISASTEEERLHAYCHCKQISLYLTRPKNDLGQSKQEQNPGTEPRFIAGHCFCTSCRLTSGSLFVTYIDVPLRNIFDANKGQAIQIISAKEVSTTLGGLKAWCNMSALLVEFENLAVLAVRMYSRIRATRLKY
ncbi:hypothetical protein CPB83DRAFT_852567 [Crepidotus variabilis]|uniref:CENP-V/GFA domain-containing protein n=1 Tax=Crepidotus variabilis TaxID=179855 RepID=A0A9P6EI41_9AGAR|nr:hypothetical protein CPB83DRAFT_852567 [Crepidotus variabilis]